MIFEKSLQKYKLKSNCGRVMEKFSWFIKSVGVAPIIRIEQFLIVPSFF